MLQGRIEKLKNTVIRRKQAEDALQYQESYFRDFVENALDIIMVLDESGNLRYINSSVERILGYRPKNLIGKSAFEFIHPQDLPKATEHFRRLLQNPVYTSTKELRIRAKDNSWHYFEGIGRNALDNSAVAGIVITAREITERKQAEDIIRRVAEEWEEIFNSIADSVSLNDKDFRIIRVNKAYCDTFNMRPEEIIGKTCYELIHGTKEPLPNCPHKRTLEDKKTNKAEFFDAHSGIYLKVSVSPICNEKGDVVATVHIIKDVTEHKQIEEALRKSEEYFRALTENSSDIVIIVDKKGTITYASPSIERFSGYKPEDLIGKNAFKFIRLDDLSRAIKDFSKAIQTTEVVIPNSFRIRHKDGSERILEGLGKNLLDNPIIKGFVMNVRDVTKRKRAEKALKESEEHFRLLAENVTDIIWTMDMNLHFTYISPSVMRQRGLSPEEAMQQSIEEVLTPASYKVAMKVFEEELIKEKQEQKDLTRSRTMELEHRCKDGSTIWCEVSMNFLRDIKGQAIGILGVSRDITERKKAEEQLEKAYNRLKETREQLIQSSKMVAMGYLATSISHELKQPLTGIKGFAQVALTSLDKKGPLREDLRKIIEQTDRMEGIIKNIRLFARKSDFKAEELQVNRPIMNALALLARELKLHNIRLKKSLAKDLPKIKGDSNQLQQVFINFIANAMDAIDSLRRPEGGDLMIKSVLSEDKKNIEITFTDTGCGISKENLGHLFNPFFTTKSPDRGTGLGLAVTYRIIEGHKGKIEVESQEGKGTEFRIFLPTIPQ